MVRGKFQWKRYFKSPAGWPKVASGQTSTLADRPVRASYRVTMPPALPKPEALDQTRLGSSGSGVAQPSSPPPTECHAPRGIPPPPPPPPSLLLLGPMDEGPSWRFP